MKQLKLLDCTLRDGGYYTNWDFDRSLVAKYLAAISAAGIEFVELGLRKFPSDEFLGPFAYATDSYLQSLPIPRGIEVGVMLDAKTILSSNLDTKSAINQLFRPATDSPVTFVRIASHFREIEYCGDLVSELKSLGYVVAINLMQASGKSDAEISSKLATLLSSGVSPDVIYFADSLGNMSANEVKRLIMAIRSSWSGQIGIHTHNNRGLAVSNSLCAIDEGATWVDATIQGMGRGAGNAEMELLLTELGQNSGYDPDSVFKLAMEEFAELRAHHRWGPSLLYYYSAIHGIHPSYAQALLAEERYDGEEKISILRYLAEQSSSNFKRDLLGTALSHHFQNTPTHDGSWSASGWCRGDSVVLVAAGPASARYASDVVAFARSREARLLTVNTVRHIPDDAVDGIVTVDQNRIRFEAAAMQLRETPVFAPLSNLPPDCIDQLKGLEVHDFGLKCVHSVVEISEYGCTLPYALSAVYAIVLALVGEARSIYLAGFEGYGPGDPRQQEMLESIELLKERLDFDARVCAVTPTTYPIRQSSLYAP